MAQERETAPIELTSIHINLMDHVVTLESTDGRHAKLSFGSPATLYEAPLPDPGVVTEEQLGPTLTELAQQEKRESERTVVLTGRLQAAPKAGRSDGRGRPTAWAPLAVHEEGSDQAHLYGATFHRHTAAIAVGLEQDSQLTVEGYPHPNWDPSGKRMDTFSVINLLDYPGKPEKQPRTRRKRTSYA